MKLTSALVSISTLPEKREREKKNTLLTFCTRFLFTDKRNVDTELWVLSWLFVCNWQLTEQRQCWPGTLLWHLSILPEHWLAGTAKRHLVNIGTTPCQLYSRPLHRGTILLWKSKNFCLTRYLWTACLRQEYSYPADSTCDSKIQCTSERPVIAILHQFPARILLSFSRKKCYVSQLTKRQCCRVFENLGVESEEDRLCTHIRKKCFLQD